MYCDNVFLIYRTALQSRNYYFTEKEMNAPRG